MKKYNIAIVGATGAVGVCLLNWLINYEFPYENIYLYASNKSKGRIISIKDKKFIVDEISADSFNNTQIAFFTSNDEVSKKYVPIALSQNNIVIDNSKTYRLVNDIPLIVGNVNHNIISKDNKLIANPNCATCILCSVLKPIIDLYTVKSVVVSTYQSISGMGLKSIDSFKKYTLSYLNNTDYKDNNYDYSFTLYPIIGDVLKDNISYEEYKIINESKKILNIDFPIYATCVRVPTINCHGEAIHIEFIKEISLEKIIEVLRQQENIIVLDNEIINNKTASNTPLIYVNRFRKLSNNSVDFFILSDNLLVGSATNAIKIAFAKIEVDNNDLL